MTTWVQRGHTFLHLHNNTLSAYNRKIQKHASKYPGSFPNNFLKEMVDGYHFNLTLYSHTCTLQGSENGGELIADLWTKAEDS